MVALDRSWIVAMPLDHAWFCVNCESVCNRQDRCPVCDAPGEQMLSLARILNRTKDQQNTTGRLP